MYDHILGEVISTNPARVVLRSAGVGYELKVPVSVSSALQPGEQACLFTILHVVDGNPSLLGFREVVERELSRKLMSVSGVGPSIALAILSIYSVQQIAQALSANDAKLLTQVKGVGSKTAERLCLELRDQVAKMSLLDNGAQTVLTPVGTEDAIAALMTLGYSEKDARKKVEKCYQQQPEASTEDIIKAVLQS